MSYPYERDWISRTAHLAITGEMSRQIERLQHRLKSQKERADDMHYRVLGEITRRLNAECHLQLAGIRITDLEKAVREWHEAKGYDRDFELLAKVFKLEPLPGKARVAA